MKTLTNIARLDHLPEESVSVYVSDQFDSDPSDEMPGDSDAEQEVDFDSLDLDYANLHFVS